MSKSGKATGTIRKAGRPPAAARSWLDPMDHMLDDVFAHQRPAGWERPFLAASALGPGMDVIERSDEIVVRVALPGVKKHDIEISVSGTLLSIRGEPREEAAKEEGEYYRREIPHGAFSRTLSLPAEVDESASRATLKEGVLELVLPKPEKSRRRKIRIA